MPTLLPSTGARPVDLAWWAMADQGRGPRFHHVPGLDGIRAFAVLAVIAFHSGFSWIPGGYYGVDAFFVLSGFLITSLLVTEWRESGTVALGRFWARRARRLLPALFVLLIAIGIVVALWPSVLNTTHLLASAVAATFYVANWHFVAGHANYFTAVSQPSPLLHTWSLAIEEQFYLVWPLVVLAVLRGRRARPAVDEPAVDDSAAGSDEGDLSGGSGVIPVAGQPGAAVTVAAPSVDEGAGGPAGAPERARRLEVLLAISIVGALASALLMAVITPVGSDPTRAYYGTDTRAQGLLVGAAVALAFARWGSVRGARARGALAGVAVLGVLVTALLWWRVPETSPLAFHGGFLLASAAAAAVVAGAVQAPRSPVALALGWGPVRALGRISYGVYLWYWPVLLVMTGSRVHLDGWPLFGARVAVTVAIAAASYHLVELPVRRGAFPGRWALVAAPAAAALALSVLLLGALLVPSEPPGPPLTASASASGGGASRPPLSATGSTLGASNGAATASGHPVRVLLVGDSVAGSLGVGLDQEAARYGIQLVNEGAPGCSVSMDQLIKVLWYTLAPGTPCRTGNPGALLRQWRTWVDDYNPDVVLYLARGELFDQEVVGQWSNLGQRGFDSYVAGRFERATTVLGSRGAAVVMLTTPYYDSGEQPSGDPWPEDEPDRVALDNEIIGRMARATDAVARARPPSAPDAALAVSARPTVRRPVTVYDLGSLASPGRHYDQYVHGVDMRCGDGVHFTAVGGEWLGHRLLPAVAALARTHHAASPTGAWPSALPPPVPSWWDRLPCG